MKNILIIGGSKGIGAALVQLELAENMVHVISREDLPFSHPHLIHYKLDALSDELPNLDALDGLVYCPGTINLKPFRSLKKEDFERDFEINVLGAVKCIQHYLPILKKSEKSSVLLFSTVAVQKGMSFHSSVAISKGAIEGLTRSLAAEFAPSILVNCIAPSITQTPLAAGILRNQEAVENLAQKHPLKKILMPEEVAQLAHFVLQQVSTTGHIYAIDGGMSVI
jgi:NAD(P)-dependent dehydrogenase (short-subunit alcohol dehydrogenase family)